MQPTSIVPGRLNAVKRASVQRAVDDKGASLLSAKPRSRSRNVTFFRGRLKLSSPPPNSPHCCVVLRCLGHCRIVLIRGPVSFCLFFPLNFDVVFYHVPFLLSVSQGWSRILSLLPQDYQDYRLSSIDDTDRLNCLSLSSFPRPLYTVIIIQKWPTYSRPYRSLPIMP